jgi:uncharacterized protein (TIGR02391 family)
MSSNKRTNTRKIPLDKETFELMKLVLCNSHILEQYIFPHARDLSEYDHIRQTVELMEKASIDRRFIYAFIKTRGLLLTKENKKYVSSEDVKEWKNAVRQYDQLTESGVLSPSQSLIPFINASKEIPNPKKSKLELEQLFDCRNFHKLIIEASRKQFLNYDFPDAIFSAYKKVLNSIKEKSGIIQEDGVSLVTAVFNPKNPVLITPLSLWTQDPSIQEGIMYLFMGAVLCVRNVFAHRDIYLTETDATLEYLSFASFLCKILDVTQKRPDSEEASTETQRKK